MNKVFAVMAMCATAAGCAPPVTNVEADWADAIARLDFVSIYPITEDLQPGDVLLSIPRETGEPRPAVQRLGSLDLKTIKANLAKQETARLTMQTTSTPGAAGVTAQGGAAKPSASTTAGINLVANYSGPASITTQVKVSPTPAAPAPGAKSQGKQSAPPKAAEPDILSPDILSPDAAQVVGNLKPRLRRVDVPYVAAARVSEGNIGGGESVSGAFLGAVIGYKHSAAVTIFLKQLESIGFDTLLAMDISDANRLLWARKNHFTAPRLLGIASRADANLGERLCLLKDAPASDRRALIQIVNRVLYAHQIQFEYQRGSDVAGKLALQLANSVAAAQGASPPTMPAAETPAGAAAAAASAGRQLTDFTGTLSLPSSPGVRTSLGVGSSGDVALNETFNQPMAVGYSPFASYTVRGSIIYTSADPKPVEQEASQLKAMCKPMQPVTDESTKLDPIERLACANTATLSYQESSLILPHRCWDALRSSTLFLNNPTFGLTSDRDPIPTDDHYDDKLSGLIKVLGVSSEALTAVAPRRAPG